AKAAGLDFGTCGLRGSSPLSLTRSSARGRRPSRFRSQNNPSPRTQVSTQPGRGRQPGSLGQPRGVWKKAVALPAAVSLPGHGPAPDDPAAAGCLGTVFGEPGSRRGGSETPGPGTTGAATVPLRLPQPGTNLVLFACSRHQKK
ncbi:hypothetical protein HispidOSU_010601, partial [Sigmodon hispidus]